MKNTSADNSALIVLACIFALVIVGGIAVLYYAVYISPKRKQSKTYVSTDIVHVTRLVEIIEESIGLIEITKDPDTFFSRIDLIFENIEKISLHDTQVSEKYLRYMQENMRKLESGCFDRYVEKARSQLKTENGVQKRIEKYKSIADNSSYNYYLKMLDSEEV